MSRQEPQTVYGTSLPVLYFAVYSKPASSRLAEAEYRSWPWTQAISQASAMLPRMSWVWAWSRPLSTHWPESLITR